MADKADKLPEDQASPEVEIDDNDYDAAFAEASDDVVTDDQTPAPASEKKEEVAETPPKSEEPPAKQEVPETPAPAPADTKALESKIAELEGKLAQKAKAEQTPSKETPEPKPAKVELSEEDQETLEEVKQDWPSIYKTMELQISQLEARITSLINDKLTGVQQQLQPVLKVTAETTQDKFIQAIEKAHPGARAQLPSVEKWIATKPAFMQAAMDKVLDEGTADEVITLLSQWKAETGVKDDTPNPAPTVPDSKSKRLASMEDVRTERTGFVADDQDPNDFDSAFDEASSA